MDPNDTIAQATWPREADYDLFIVTYLTLNEESRDVHNHGNPSCAFSISYKDDI
jgi:hypothetical protein